MSKLKGVVSHYEAERRAGRAACLLTLRPFAEAFDVLGQVRVVMTSKRVEFVLDAQAARTKMLATGMGYDIAEVHAYLAAQIAGRRPAKPKQKSWRR